MLRPPTDNATQEQQVRKSSLPKLQCSMGAASTRVQSMVQPCPSYAPNPVLQTGGSPAARGAGAPDDPGSGDVAGEQLQASQEDGRGSRGATQQQQLSAHKDVWVDDADSEVPHWALQQQPAALAQPGSLLASHQHLFALPGTPRQLMFAIRAALEQRGDPETRLGSLEMLVPHDQDNTQCMGWVRVGHVLGWAVAYYCCQASLQPCACLQP